MNHTTATKPTTATRASTTRGRPKSTPRGDAQGTSLKLWVVLARAYGAIARQAEIDVARHGLTGSEFGILEVLHHKGPLLLGEIQKKVLVTSGGITYLVDRLVAKGFVRREECPNDRRARYAVLTPSGAALIRRIFPEHAKMLERSLSALTTREQVGATKLLRRLGLGAERARNE